jgi:parallel beta-helix repeat protein
MDQIQLKISDPISDLIMQPTADNPIGILNNSAFSLYGFSGLGTKASPYLIEDLYITNSTTGIEIRDTDAYFIVRNCSINGINVASYAVYFDNVTNGVFEGNFVYNCTHGVYSYLSHGNTYQSNFFANRGTNGIYLAFSDYNFVNNNTFHGDNALDTGIKMDNGLHNIITENTFDYLTEAGIWAEYSTNNTVNDNEFDYNYRGFYLINSNSNFSITDNEIWDNTYGFEIDSASDILIDNNNLDGNIFGILFSQTDLLTISNNNITFGNSISIQSTFSTIYSLNITIDNNYISGIGNSLTGIRFCSFTNNYITDTPYDTRIYNTGQLQMSGNIFNSSSNGLLLNDVTNDSTVTWNTFLDHTTHITDDGGSNNISYNFYDDWTTPDTNSDGIVDSAYSLAGTASNTDPYPLAASNDLDNDNDELSNYMEIVFGTDPENPDSDLDNLKDGEEVTDYFTNPTLNDTDADRLLDGDEVLIYLTNPLNPDTDNDTLSDGQEVLDYNTNPLDEDTDGDSYSDGVEIDAGTDPLDPDSYPKLFDPELVLEDPISIVILAVSGVATTALAGGIAIQTFFSKISNKFTQITQSLSEWTLIKDALSGQISEIASSITKRDGYFEDCPKCDAAKLGPYCYVCGTTLSHEEAELVKKEDSKKTGGT